MSDLQPGFSALPPEHPLEDKPLTPAEKPTLRRFFFGDDGLRAGWSVLLFLILVILIGMTIGFILKLTHTAPPVPPSQANIPHPMKPRSALIQEVIQFAVFALAAWCMSLIERRPFARYGLPRRRMLQDFGVGLCWGFAFLSLLIGALYATHSIAFDGFVLWGTTAWLYAAKWALVFLFVGLGEEFVTRGYLQFTIARGVSGIVRTMDPANRHSHAIGFWITAFLLSVCLFAGGHLANSGESAVGITAVGLVGIVFAFSLYRTGSLWWAIGFHTSWDWAQSYFYGTPDSGLLAIGHLTASHPTGSPFLSGSPTGPEGSIFIIPTLLLVAVVIHLTLPRRIYPLTPDQSPLPQPPPLVRPPVRLD